jgi:ABC-type glycerol-3-phosphate transport system permease component
VSDVRQIEIHTAEPLVHEPSPFEVEIAIANMKRYKSPGSDQIPAELVQEGDEILSSKIHKLITSIWNKEELPDRWKESIIVLVYKNVIKLTVVIIVGYHCYQLRTKFYTLYFFQGYFHT